MKQGQPNLKVLVTRLLLVLEVCNVKPTYRKSIGWESFDVVRFDLRPLLRGYPNLKVLITGLLLVLEVWDGKPNYRKSCAPNLLLVSDLTLDPSFEVKCGSSYL